MKKQLLMLLVVIASISANAQTFKLTPEGFVNSADTSKNYIVLEFPGKTQSDLFKSSLIYFTSAYVSPQDVISKVDNEVITINGVKESAIAENKMASPFNINYTIVYKFKDGKVKIEAPTFKMYVGLRKKYLVYTGFSMNGQESGVYGKNGKVKSERALNDLEALFNGYISDYKGAINKKSDADF